MLFSKVESKSGSSQIKVKKLSYIVVSWKSYKEEEKQKACE